MRYVMLILMLVMMAMGCASATEPESTAAVEAEVVMVDSLDDFLAAFGPQNPIEECQCSSGGMLCCRDVDRSMWWCFPWVCLAPAPEKEPIAAPDPATTPATMPARSLTDDETMMPGDPGTCFVRLGQGFEVCCTDYGDPPITWCQPIIRY